MSPSWCQTGTRALLRLERTMNLFGGREGMGEGGGGGGRERTMNLLCH